MRAVVQNGVEGNKYYQIEKLAFSADSQHLTYVARGGDFYNNKWFNVLDGIEGTKYNSGPIPGLQFSPDGARNFFLYNGLYVDGVEFKKRVDKAFFSPNSRRIAYVTGIDWNTTYSGGASMVGVDGGPEQGPFRTVAGNIWFSPDSQRIAYVASASMEVNERRWVVVVDGKPGKPYFEIASEITFSPDSNHLSYKVYAGPSDGRSFVVLDGTEGSLYSNVSDLVFSADSSRLAYVALKSNIKKAFIVVNGVEGKYYDGVSKVAFSPDGKHLVYFAQEGQDWFAVVDGIEMKHYERILGQEPNGEKKSAIVFDSVTSFYYLALSGENIYLVHETVQ
jgi:hypothetical protein